MKWKVFKTYFKTYRIIVPILGLLVFSALVVYLAWVLEASQKGVKTVVIKKPPNDSLFAVEFYRDRKGKDVIIQCDEKDFQDAFTYFAKFLRVKAKPIRVPGGAMLLAKIPTGDVPAILQPAKRAILESLKDFLPRRIILLAHSECYLYEVAAAWQNNLEEVKAKQIHDLKTAKDTLEVWFPKAKIEVYYAQKEGNILKFNQLFKEKKGGINND